MCSTPWDHTAMAHARAFGGQQCDILHDLSLLWDSILTPRGRVSIGAWNPCVLQDRLHISLDVWWTKKQIGRSLLGKLAKTQSCANCAEHGYQLLFSDEAALCHQHLMSLHITCCIHVTAKYSFRWMIRTQMQVLSNFIEGAGKKSKNVRKRQSLKTGNG